jgi:hypothetical protein
VFNTARFDAAVTRFKTQFAGHPKLFEYGQFYVTSRTFDDLMAAATNAMSVFPLAAGTFIPFLRTALNRSPRTVDLAAITRQLDQCRPSGSMSAQSAAADARRA